MKRLEITNRWVERSDQNYIMTSLIISVKTSKTDAKNHQALIFTRGEFNLIPQAIPNIMYHTNLFKNKK